MLSHVQLPKAPPLSHAVIEGLLGVLHAGGSALWRPGPSPRSDSLVILACPAFTFPLPPLFPQTPFCSGRAASASKKKKDLKPEEELNLPEGEYVIERLLGKRQTYSDDGPVTEYKVGSQAVC